MGVISRLSFLLVFVYFYIKGLTGSELKLSAPHPRERRVADGRPHYYDNNGQTAFGTLRSTKRRYGLIRLKRFTFLINSPTIGVEPDTNKDKRALIRLGNCEKVSNIFITKFRCPSKCGADGGLPPPRPHSTAEF
ncbi:hypothetical protein EVAR_53385_1 [Eumeta japonica]|uniref:Uncharacterized protein n=1 Tax=Eumeta variegata TaxID=151549 RepID=A0A4C1Y9I3_EUMVA|nr:hypothetical protein EVAR_53385_1 [Eumeta japonica]